jgi:hypothetical protein
MMTVNLTSAEIKKLINKEIKIIHDAAPRKRVSSGRVLEIDRRTVFQQGECNWFASAYMNISEYETEVLQSVEVLRKTINLID